MMPTVPKRPRPGTDCARVLAALEKTPGAWVEDIYAKTKCIVHSRINNLRDAGYVIEMKRFGHRDYRYRLAVVQPVPLPAPESVPVAVAVQTCLFPEPARELSA